MKNAISVVIPVYNRTKELIRALQSVKAQTLQPAEVIVVDDCSPFSVKDFLQENGWLGPELAPVVRVVRNDPNQGPSGSRNAGVREANGEFIAFLDSDDYWDKYKLAKQMQLFERNPTLDLVYNNTWLVYQDKTVPSSKELFRDNIWHQLVDNCWTPPNPSTMLIKREAMQKLNSFDTSLKHAEDIDLWMRMMLENMKVDYCNEPLTYFTFDSTGRLTKQYNDKFKRVEPFFAKWKTYFYQMGKTEAFENFKKRSFTKFAIENFVDSLKDRAFDIPVKMYFKYLWHRKEFYNIVFQKFFRASATNNP